MVKAQFPTTHTAYSGTRNSQSNWYKDYCCATSTADTASASRRRLDNSFSAYVSEALLPNRAYTPRQACICHIRDARLQKSSFRFPRMPKILPPPRTRQAR